VPSYQVLARKWRPQRFDDVIGQRGVTQTLRNAIGVGRIAQSFVFSGPRGVGKTTTARILARALNCEKGPTADPCGECDACIEIAHGRDMDVLEIDAATHTGVDKVRDVIVSSLATGPARDKYKIFIIDEVHRLSPQSFDALLKSIEEPPPHVVFMMATTEIDKVPATIQSRSQVFELKAIGVKAIADQLRVIADAEGIAVDDATLMLVARAGDGSMRDAQSALDQVIAFSGTTIAPEDVATVLGLVRRDLLIEIAEAIAREDAAAVFELAGRAVESGYDLKLVIRELGRLTRDLLVVGIDPSRLQDLEIAAEAEREPLRALAARFSSEDLMRAFEVLTRAEADIKVSMQPRYHLEMTLLRWIHLRKLVPLSNLIDSLDAPSARPGPSSVPARPPQPATRVAAPPASARVASPVPAAASTVKAVEARLEQARAAQPAPAPAAATPAKAAAIVPAAETGPALAPLTDPALLKEAFLAELQKAKRYFYGTVIAQAQRIDVERDRIVLAFAPRLKAIRDQVEPVRAVMEDIASKLAGRRMAVAAIVATESGTPEPLTPGAAAAPADRQTELRQQALADKSVQALLDVFGTQIKDVEER
jgi:DNA polymerase-3 subunit gamma/tau